VHLKFLVVVFGFCSKFIIPFLIIGILRYNGDLPEPVMLAMATELSSFGFFQRGTYVYRIIFSLVNSII
jgi:hypothetical protein